MKHSLAKLALILPAIFMFSTAQAEQTPGLEQARQQIAKLFTEVKAKDISPSPIPGLFQVMLPPRIFYASADGRYIFNGDVIDMQQQHNITKDVRNKALITAVNDIGEDNMVIFGNDTLKHTITVFTDIDCTYCRKLHDEIAEYNKHGFRVRYLAFPRAGIGSPSFQKAEAVWCSKDKQKAMTAAKAGQPVTAEKCASPVANHYALGQMIGIRGTPAIVFDDGTVVPGYIPAARLNEAVQQMAKRN